MNFMKIAIVLALLSVVVGWTAATLPRHEHHITKAEAKRLCGPIDKSVCAVCRCGFSEGDVVQHPSTDDLVRRNFQ